MAFISLGSRCVENLKVNILQLPLPHTDLQTLSFSAGHVLFWPPTGRVWVLNSSAALAWDFLQKKFKKEAAIAAFADFFDIPEELADQGMNTALDSFAAEGLLEGGTPQPLPVEQTWPQPLATEYSLPSVAQQHSRQINVAGLRIGLYIDDKSLADWFNNLLSPFAGEQPEKPTKINLVATANETKPETFDVAADSTLWLEQAPRDQVVPALMTLIFMHASARLKTSMLLHAAVLVRNHTALLLPAESGSGKTTLAAELASRGWTFYSDELAVLDPLSGHILPLALPLSIKSGSVAALQRNYPQLATLPVWNRTDGKQVRFLTPPLESLPRQRSGVKVSRIVFPAFHENGDDVLQPLSKGDALQLLAQTGSSDRVSTLEDIRAMIALVEEADCRQLFFTDCHTAAETLDSL